MEAVVFDIQKFSVHDGPGIRTIVFFKGCPLRCVWCSNPESQDSKPEIMWYPERCRQLDNCVRVCGRGAVSVVDGSLSFNRDLCNACGRCAEVCYAGVWKVAGRVMDTEALFAEVAKDIEFYRQSGGGVTLGGGEPLLWPKAVRELGSKCRAAGIHVVAETCGHVSWDVFEQVSEVIDLFLYDLKHMDSNLHTRLCGAGNELILENLQRLLREKSDVVVRVPVVPGRNDSEENIEAIAKFVSRNGGTRIDLLPFHRFGAAKFNRLGRRDALVGTDPPGVEAIQRLRDLVGEYGLTLGVGD